MSAKFNNTILVAPLDWGLGHSTRCIPIIKHLEHIGCNVIIAAEGPQYKLLHQEFPHLQFIQLKGYRIKYANNKRFFSAKILMQVPKIYRVIQSEKKWLEEVIRKHNITAVISDNRYGLCHHTIPSIFITHQLTIKGPFTLAEKFLQKINYHFINKFSECWVPDEDGTVNLAGLLSHPASLPNVPVKYIGPLSRFERSQTNAVKYNLLIVLSGPEPQRTTFENKILADLKTFNGTALLIRGLPGDASCLVDIQNVVIKNHLTSSAMEVAFNESDLIISRSGYTTVMDIFKLRKKAILIPTPGQTEQEYLAKHLNQQGWCVAVAQHGFSLTEALQLASVFPFKFPELEMKNYKTVVENFIENLP